jgi:hypothetical protein
MQVFGLPGHIIRTGKLASRIVGSPHVTKPRSAGPRSPAGAKPWLMGS